MQALQDSQAKARQAVSRSVQLQKTVQEKDKVSDTQPDATSWTRPEHKLPMHSSTYKNNILQ